MNPITNRYFWLYLLCINVITFILFGVDKHKAVHDQWRIPEKRLLFSSFLGGEIGAMAGMRFFRHKTKTRVFLLGEPFILVLHIAIILIYIFWHRVR